MFRHRHQHSTKFDQIDALRVSTKENRLNSDSNVDSLKHLSLKRICLNYVHCV